MYIIYILQHSEKGEIYIGFTKNLNQRLKSHNSNSNQSTSRQLGKWILVYAEAYRSESDARIRERKLKHHGSAKHSLVKRIENSFIDIKNKK